MSFPTSISADKLARLIGTATTPALIDVRPTRTSPPISGSFLGLGQTQRVPHKAADWGGRFAGRPVIVVGLRGQGLAHGTAAWLRDFHGPSRGARGRLRGLEGREASAGARIETAGARRAGPHRLGDPCAAKDRPRRLSLVDRGASSIRTRRSSSSRLPRTAAVGERFNAAPFDIEKGVLWPSRRVLHVRRDGRGVRSRHAAVVAAGNHGAGRRYRAARALSGSAGTARGIARPVLAGCMTAISNSSRPASRCTMPSIAGAAMRPEKPTNDRLSWIYLSEGSFVFQTARAPNKIRARAALGALGIAFIVGAITIGMMDVGKGQVLRRNSRIVRRWVSDGENLPAKSRHMLRRIRKDIKIPGPTQKVEKLYDRSVNQGYLAA